MAKTVTKPAAAKAEKPKADASSRKVSGIGFSKTFSASELKNIREKREAMRSRLFAAG
jgi:hypothetical protein